MGEALAGELSLIVHIHQGVVREPSPLMFYIFLVRFNLEKTIKIKTQSSSEYSLPSPDVACTAVNAVQVQSFFQICGIVVHVFMSQILNFYDLG